VVVADSVLVEVAPHELVVPALALLPLLVQAQVVEAVSVGLPLRSQSY